MQNDFSTTQQANATTGKSPCLGTLSRSILAATALAAAPVGMSQAAVTTEFSVSGQTGSFQIGSATLNAIGQLSGAGSTYNYIGQFFTPTVSGNYTFGTSKADFDTVLIFYQGSYNSASPGTNAIGLNDDSSGAQAGHGLANAGTCSSPNWCSELTNNLTAGTDYYVVTTTYNAGTAVSGTVWFYVIGPAGVGVGGVPPAPAVTVLSSAQTLSNSPSYGAAQVIDNTPELLNLFSGLSGDQEISNAASQTLPLLTGGSAIAAGNALSGINKVVQARIEANRGMSSGNDFAGDRHIWLKPFGSWADQNDRKGVSGFKSDTAGVVVGVDVASSGALRLGGAFAYAKADVDGNSSIARQSVDVDVYQLVAYGSYSLDDRTELNFQVDVGKNRNEGRRTIAFTNTVARSSYDSHTAHAGVGLARSYALGERTSITPSIRADYTWIKDKSYRETGAGLLNLNVDSRTTDELILSVEGKLNHALSENTSISANLGVGYDTLSERTSITAAFAGAPGAAFTTEGLDPSPWLARAGVGLSHTTGNGTEITLRYDAEHRSDFLNQTASIKARWAF